jgi:hypothetical protein
MANIPIYSGSVDFTVASSSYYSVPSTGSSPTPFGFYDSDNDFKGDANRVTDFCARRLGYPIENVELQDIQFWAAFEEAVTVYGNELYAFKVRDNLLSIEGADNPYSFTGPDINHSIVTPSFDNIVRLSLQYGEEAGVGGNVDWKSGSIDLEAGIQDYDLVQWAENQNITGGIEVKQVFYQDIPAVSEMYSPWAGLGGGFGGAAGLGFSGLGYGPGINFLLMPLSFDMQTIQAIEMSNQVRLSNYTFQLINNKLRIFPIPFFEYESAGSLVTTPNTLLSSITTPSTNTTDGTYIVIPTTNGGGTNATLIVTVVNDIITNITATTAGSGYNQGDILTIPGGTLGSLSTSVIITLEETDITNRYIGNPAKLWFNYIELDARINASITDAPAKITNESNAPYNNPIYSQINSVGRSWIFEYTLAIVKETLGYVRGKYATVPIPGAEVTLNQSDLLTAATAEKNSLIERLRTYFNETSRQALLERRQAESVARVAEINNVPMTIFIG